MRGFIVRLVATRPTEKQWGVGKSYAHVPDRRLRDYYRGLFVMKTLSPNGGFFAQLLSGGLYTLHNVGVHSTLHVYVC